MKREGKRDSERDVVVIWLHKRAVDQGLVEIEDKGVGRNVRCFGRKEVREEVVWGCRNLPETSLCGVEDIEGVKGDFGQLLLCIASILVFVEAWVQLVGWIKKLNLGLMGGYELARFSSPIEFRYSWRLLLISTSHSAQKVSLRSIVALGEKGSFAYTWSSELLSFSKLTRGDSEILRCLLSSCFTDS